MILITTERVVVRTVAERRTLTYVLPCLRVTRDQSIPATVTITKTKITLHPAKIKSWQNTNVTSALISTDRRLCDCLLSAIYK